MEEFYEYLDNSVLEISKQFNISNLIAIQDVYDENDYWTRLANFSFFNKIFDEHRYHFLYEIQGLSCQIHFGLANCFLFRDKISAKQGRPNVYNHRYTFMIESTIHCIYAYWNRVGLVLNTYLKTLKDIKRTYFSGVVQQLRLDYPELLGNPYYLWINDVKTNLDDLNRNEFAHNNSLIMQNFLPESYEGQNQIDLLAFPELLLSHNKYIVEEIDNLVNLIEVLEGIVLKK
ncbi:hypothetical protein SAMN05421813_11017 [Daejeonella rubra]|uniref:Cthe-2314-like HEPN domain-containing protein n=1 Tax=Daejeonella rubra TaxID=990371 RepID=A0A1G9SEE6_9SPHI|nr:hypothetical protein [Daejeonella rubra]SDM33761.1 hypothetical protein SAMN05421813_11017 [Daejeonella rubra]